MQGTLASDTDPLSVIAYAQANAGPFPLTNQILGPAFDGDIWTVTIAYQNNDVLHWQFNLRAESEAPMPATGGVACAYSTAQARTPSPVKYTFMPDTITVPVPPQQDVFGDARRVDIAAPACSYQAAEAEAFCVRGNSSAGRRSST